MSVTWNSSKQSSHVFLGDRVGDVPDRIAVGDASPIFSALPDLAHALVHVGHEFVEMRAPLALHVARVKEQVHQHGLAAADVAIDVQALDRPARFAAREQPAERGRFARQPVCGEPVLKRTQLLRQGRLRAIGLDLAGGDERGVAISKRV